MRRFDENRRHIFKYAMFAHALGIPRPQADNLATDVHEDKFPRTISGVSDGGPGGGDFVITLGLWDNHVGHPFVQKATLLHELGHALGLKHGGFIAGLNQLPNCKPNYQSSMNYLFQIRGLIGNGGPAIGYSKQVLNPLNEHSLSETALTTATNAAADWGTRWYAPLASSALDQLTQTSPSGRHCDGTEVGGTEPQMVRIDGTYPPGAIDWNAMPTPVPQPYAQDVNFNGQPADPIFQGSNDWSHVDLRQTGGRRNSGPLSLEISIEDLGLADPLVGVNGSGMWGGWDWGGWDWGGWDWGGWDWGGLYGGWDWGGWDWGGWDWGGWDWGEIDERIAISQGPSANTLTFTTTNKTIDVKWIGPQAGGTILRVTTCGERRAPFRSRPTHRQTSLQTGLLPVRCAMPLLGQSSATRIRRGASSTSIW